MSSRLSYNPFMLMCLCGVLMTAPLRSVASEPAVTVCLRLLHATDLNAKPCELPAAGASATVLFFVIHDCPICNRYAPEIIRITDDYKSRHVVCYVVYVESDFSAAQASQHAKEYGFQCGLLRDPSHELSRSTGADVAPEAVLIASNGSVAYRGRIDDTFVAFGMKRAQPISRDLRNALDSLLAGAPIASPNAPAVGCAIPKD